MVGDVHLLTLEAFDVSNQHHELATIVYRIAEARGLRALQVRNAHRPEPFTLAAEWMILARAADAIDKIARALAPLHDKREIRVRNQARAAHADVRVWTDDSSSLLRILE